MACVFFYLADNAVLDVDYLIGLVGNAALMGYHYDGDAFFLVKLLEELHHLHAGLGVKGTGRFIGQDNLRFGDEGTGNRNALPLAAGHLVGEVGGPLGEWPTG